MAFPFASSKQLLPVNLKKLLLQLGKGLVENPLPLCWSQGTCACCWHWVEEKCQRGIEEFPRGRREQRQLGAFCCALCKRQGVPESSPGGVPGVTPHS